MATRRDLFDPTDPPALEPEQRLTQVATILAAGVLRMRARWRADLLARDADIRTTMSRPPKVSRGAEA